MKNKRIWGLLAIVWFLIVTGLLCIPGSDLPQSGFFDMIPFFDKWVHIFLFCVLTYAFQAAFLEQKGTRNALKIVLLAICYGTAMEFVQKYFIPNRSFDLTDILADAIGSFLGYLVIVFQRKRENKKES